MFLESFSHIVLGWPAGSSGDFQFYFTSLRTTKNEKKFHRIARLFCQMRSVFVTVMIVVAITAFAGKLEDLKAASVRYVAAMKAVLAIPDDSDCPGLVA